MINTPVRYIDRLCGPFLSSLRIIPPMRDDPPYYHKLSHLMHQVLIDFSCTLFLEPPANVEIIQQSLKYVKLCSGAMLCYYSNAGLNQLSVILLYSSCLLGNIWTPITDGLTHFLIKFVLLTAPLRRKKINTKVLPPHTLPLPYHRVLALCVRSGTPQPWLFHAGRSFPNAMIAWFQHQFETFHSQCQTQ